MGHIAKKFVMDDELMFTSFRHGERFVAVKSRTIRCWVDIFGLITWRDSQSGWAQSDSGDSSGPPQVPTPAPSTTATSLKPNDDDQTWANQRWAWQEENGDGGGAASSVCQGKR